MKKYDLKVKFVCNDCDVDFIIQYNSDLVEDSPHFCPFCCSYIEEDNEKDEESLDYEEDEE